MISSFSIRLALCALLAAAIFGAGWKAKGWQVDSVNLAVAEAAKEIRDNAIQRESDIAGQVEAKLSTLTANQTVIDRGIIREIQKPIYQRVCLEPGVISLLNAAARGEAPPAPAKPTGQVPGNSEPAH